MKLPNQERVFFFVAAALYLAVSLILYPTLSADFFAIHSAPNRFSAIIDGDLRSGRFFSAAIIYLAAMVGIDPITHYPVYVAMTALAIAGFLRRLYLKYFKLELSLPRYTFFCFSFLFSGAMLDLLSFREVPHHPLIMFALAFLYLAVDDLRLIWIGVLSRALLVILLLGTYQASAIMILLFAVLRWIFTCLDDTKLRSTIHSALLELAAILAGFVGYWILKGVVENNFLTNITRTFIDYRDHRLLVKRAFEHFVALLELFKTPSPLYLWSHVGVGLVVAWVGLLCHAVSVRHHKGVASLILAILIVAILQNPMNFVLSSYWPTLRSSFYIALVPGLLIAYVYDHSKTLIVQESELYVLTILFCVYATAATILLADVYELRNRDRILAHDIAKSIRTLPGSTLARKIRMPPDYSRMVTTYYSGIDQLRFDFGTPIMMVGWSLGHYMRYVTGVNLEFDPVPARCGESTSEPRLMISVQHEVVEVCF